ncbi:hypothetical protein [Sulfurimonas sp. NWX79]|uniref:hypothetical protein n=1 Tax=Sulfurimonas sp. NWX79 TaxID=2925412 RepID=UPI0032049151
MSEEDHVFNENRSITQERVADKIAKIKQTQRLIKRLERLEIEIARLNKQLDTKNFKRTELLEELDAM